jgi:ATP-dependent DNA helicase PIF1
LRDHLIDKLYVLFNKCGSNIKEYNLPQKTNSTGSIHSNRFIEEELSYNFDTLSQTTYNLRVKLNDQQLHAFNTIVDTILSNIFVFFFLSGYGGTGKTFLWNAIITHLRAQKRIVLTVASSGVASLLLPVGRTTHSRFRIPCELDKTSTCDIKRGTMLAELIESASLIFWDEEFMTHRNSFEALDRSLHDLLSLKSAQSATIPFGGKVIVLGGRYYL